jgi:type IV secretion system protein VirB5
MKHLFIPAALLLGLAASGAQAQGVPTSDVKSLGQLIQQLTEAKAQLKEQILQNLKLDDQTLKLVQQVQTLQQQYAALTQGLSLLKLNIDPKTWLTDVLPTWGDLTTSLTSAQSGNWSSVTASGQVGAKPAGTFVDDLFKSVGLTSADVAALTGSTDASAARIGSAANTSAFLSVAAQESAEAASRSLTRLDGFAKQIETTTNLKEAMDLNTAATVELGVALAGIWSAESVQIVGMGQAGVMDAATAAEEEKFLKVMP